MSLYQDSHERVVGAMLEMCTPEGRTTHIYTCYSSLSWRVRLMVEPLHMVAFPLEIGYQGSQASSEFAAPSSRLT